MGAQDAALRAILAQGHTPATYSAALEQVRAALTDALPVFTLEEVRRVMTGHVGKTDIEGTLIRLTALRR